MKCKWELFLFWGRGYGLFFWFESTQNVYIGLLFWEDLVALKRAKFFFFCSRTVALVPRIFCGGLVITDGKYWV